MASRSDTDERPAYDPAEARRRLDAQLGEPTRRYTPEELGAMSAEEETAIRYAADFYGHQVERPYR